MKTTLSRNFTILLCAFFSVIGLMAQPKVEIRAVWLTTNGGADWPKSTYSEATQKSRLITILNQLEQANFNTIIFQAQVKGDVAWDSKIQPAMYDFTGNGSNGISWDICNFVIDECHKRNMECHAWIVPYRIGTASEANRYTNNQVKHVSISNPELCVTYNNAKYLDPGLPETREYLINLYKELITNYDFDGTNFDYTRYPGADFDDSTSYSLYGNGQSKDDWRRENINKFVHEFYDMAKSINPNIKVGAAPIGTYKNVSPYGNMTAYGSVYQDACEWMQSSKQDLLIPQMYWNEKYGFSPNMTTWVTNSANRQLVIGLAPYKMTDGTNNWETSVVTDQIEKIRAKAGVHGVCFFRTDHVIGTQSKIKALYTELQNNYFKYPAHIVPMSYNGVTMPNKPLNVKYFKDENSYRITWDTPATSEKPIKYYCIYAAENSDPNISDIKNCVGFAVKGNEFTYTPSSDLNNLNFVVTAFDTNYYESDITKAISGVEFTNADESNIDFSIDDASINISGEDIRNITVADISGRIIATYGTSDITIQKESLPSGAYLVIITQRNNSKTIKKIIL